MLQELFRPWILSNASWHDVCVLVCVFVCMRERERERARMIRAGMIMHDVTVGTRGQGFVIA